MEKSKIDEQRLLLLEARAGDLKSLDSLMESLKPTVTRIARSYFLTNGDSSDLIQEGMIGLYKAFLNYRLDSPVSFEQYATTCIRRQVISAVRSSLNQKNMPLNQYIGIGAQGGLMIENGDEIEDDDFEYVLPSEELTPEEKVLLIERTQELEKQIKSTLSEFELVVLNKYLRGESYKEIAKSLDKNEKSIDNAIMRIKTKLKFLED
ncbi:MAG: sigma-70 family RNA polymerase sigma factor [Clostridia bacterium]|nr:sigma-70 family RNA polymerase sigma factor [Clostridia bacterium]